VRLFSKAESRLHLLGLDHQWLAFRFSGRDMRLTGAQGRMVEERLA